MTKNILSLLIFLFCFHLSNCLSYLYGFENNSIIFDTITVSKVWELETAVTNAKGGTLILIEDGAYQLTKPLILRSDSVTIQGKNRDRDKVILRGNGMESQWPPHGIAIYASDITISDVTIG